MSRVINIKQIGDQPVISLNVQPDASIGSIKEELAGKCAIPMEQMRIIYKAK